MNRWLGIGICGLAVAASGQSNANFKGTVVDGTQDYSDEAFRPLLEDVAPRIAAAKDPNEPGLIESYVAALERIACPKGPLAGLRVTLCPVGEKAGERETTTNEKGIFHFERLATGEYDLTVYEPGPAGAELEAFRWRLHVANDYRQPGAVLALPRKYVRARGRVADSAGRPLAGVRIQAYEYFYNGELGRWSAVFHLVETATDDRGRYELTGLHPLPFWPGDGGPAGYFLKVAGEGYVPATRKIDAMRPETRAAAMKLARALFDAAGETGGKEWQNIKWPVPTNERGVLEGVDFTLLRPAALGGTVCDAAGAPIAGATVWLRDLDEPPYQPMPFSPEHGSAQTDSAGHFSIAGAKPGRYHPAVAASARNWEYREIEIELAEGEIRTNLDLRYERPGR